MQPPPPPQSRPSYHSIPWKHHAIPLCSFFVELLEYYFDLPWAIFIYIYCLFYYLRINRQLYISLLIYRYSRARSDVQKSSSNLSNKPIWYPKQKRNQVRIRMKNPVFFPFLFEMRSSCSSCAHLLQFCTWFLPRWRVNLHMMSSPCKSCEQGWQKKPCTLSTRLCSLVVDAREFSDLIN